MLEDDRIESEAKTAIDFLQAIVTVYERDGFISPKYLNEKATNAKYVVEWLIGLTE